MPGIRYNHNSFSTGIISKSVQGNTELEGYNNALDECVNFQIQHKGGLFKRGGSYFVAETKNNQEAKLILFAYSAEDVYVCEFGDKYIRFFTKYGPLKKNNIPVEVVTDLTLNDIKNTKTFQDGNILNLVTPNGIYQLKRTTVDTFTLEKIEEYTCMPLTFMNTENIALKPSAKTDSIIFTAVNPKNPDEKPNVKFAPVFYAFDQNNYLVLTYIFTDGKTSVYYLKIEAVTTDGDFKKLTCVIDKDRSLNIIIGENQKPELPNLDPVTRWQVSAFTANRGTPRAAATYEGRLFLANNLSYPTGIWGSSLMYNDLFDFYTGANKADAVQFKVNMQQTDEILWLASQSKMFAGTKGGIYIAGAAAYNDEAISPDNFRIRLLEAVGASSLQPVVALDSVFFVDAAGKNVHEIVLSADTGAYKANDVSLLANDLTQSGIIAHAWQQTPTKTYWCAVNDGFLCALTYLKNNGILAWSKHVIAGNNVRIESLAVMQKERNDYLWMIVHREINREIKRYIEYIHPPYDPLGQEEFKQFYVDSGITKELKHTISGIQRSRNTHITTNIPDTIGNSNELIVVFKGKIGLDVNPLLRKTSYTAKNITKTGFDLYSDLRSYNSKIRYGKLNPLDYSDFSTYGVYTFIKASNIINVGIGADTSIECDARLINDGDEVIIMRSGISEKGKNVVDYEASGFSFKAVGKTADGFRLHTLTGASVRSDAFALSANAEVFKKYNPVTKFDIGTNTIITLETSLPADYNGDIYVNKVYGMIQINNVKYKIAWVSTQDRKQIVVYDYRASPNEKSVNIVLDSYDYYEYDSSIENNGNVYRYFRTVEGLGHLKNQQVDICSNGNSVSPKTVGDNGIIMLDHDSMYCSAGLKIKSYMKTVPFSAGAIFGSSDVGCVGQQKSAFLYVYNSLGGKYGTEKRSMFPIQYPDTISFNKSKKLVTGLIKSPVMNASDPTDRSICIEHDDPLSFNMLSLTQDIWVADGS